MANVSPSTFWTQADALLRKNLTYQKRNLKTNLRLILIPVFFCVLVDIIERKTDSAMNNPDNKCGCICTNNTSGNNCQKLCGVKYSNPYQALKCAIPKPPEWPPLLQLLEPVPRPLNMLLFTAQNHSFAQSLSEKIFPSASTTSLSEDNVISLDTLATYVLGTSYPPSGSDNFYEVGLSKIVYLQTQCRNDSFISFQLPGMTKPLVVQAICAKGILSWRNTSSDINNELFEQDIPFDKKKDKDILNEKVSAFDFLNSNEKRFNVTIWYQYGRMGDYSRPMRLLRIPRYLNLISNAYLQFLRPGSNMLFDFVKEMPKHETLPEEKGFSLTLLLFTLVIVQLFPVAVTALVYEKEKKLRIIMKMHGLGDGPYWMISYGYFVAISIIYMLFLVIFGSFLGLKIFFLNDYSIQFVFYMVYVNLQISMALLMASIFSNVKLATQIAYSFVLMPAILADTSFIPLIGNNTSMAILMELHPVFALYRGLYEFSEYSTVGGMAWKDVSDKDNGIKEVLIIMLVECIIASFAAYYIDRVLCGRSPLFFLERFQKKPPSASIQRKLDEMEKPDVIQEMEKVGKLLQEPTNNHAIVCDDLKKVYPGRDGNPDKFAVRGLFLAVPRGECFGMLGPNGAGKTSFISMMIGLTKPSSGSAFVEGLDINTDMNGIYTCMGVCPQHDLLWETLTGREHLLFYGRLKNLQGSFLNQAVEESLKSLNLFHGGVADKQCGKYSGGMKRRLSVAISLIGDPKVVYMDEPSTGLDPASRNCLWNVIKVAKRNRAIILTTHSMEEAEYLCDRLGIFVDGRLQCVGNSKELKGRYGGTYVLTITTSSDHEEDVENMVQQQLTPNANRIYCLSGTQKFELPKDEVRIADVFRAVDAAKRKFTVSAWGLAETTLEDVFIKVARGAQIFQT